MKKRSKWSESASKALWYFVQNEQATDRGHGAPKRAFQKYNDLTGIGFNAISARYYKLLAANFGNTLAKQPEPSAKPVTDEIELNEISYTAPVSKAEKNFYKCMRAVEVLSKSESVATVLSELTEDELREVLNYFKFNTVKV